MAPFLHPTFGPLHLGRPAVSPRDHKTMAKAFLVHDYLADIGDPPDNVDNTGGRVDFGMMLNDTEGDCTCAACGHMIQVWNGVTVPDVAIQTEYEQACGYVPGDPSTDQGGYISRVLDYFRDTGVGGYKISAHAEVNVTQKRVQQAIYVFGAIDIGIQLPISAQHQVGTLWDFESDYPDTPGAWGGHSVAVVKYDLSGLWCVTWGALQKMTWRWFMFYCDEAHAAISPDDNKSPGDIDQLVSDLHEVGT